MRILVVEDDQDFAEGLADVLELEGHQVSVASSGEEAIDLFAERSFQVTLLDMQLPGINGVECLRRLKEMNGEVVVLLITGYSAPALLDEGLRAGAREVLQKPFDSGVLLELIEGR